MKKELITFLLVITAIFINITAVNAKKFRALETNAEGQIISITVCKGNKNKITTPLKKYVIAYNKEGIPSEKQLFVWDPSSSSWKQNSVYKYEYNTYNELSAMQYNKTGNKTEYWNIEYEMFSVGFNHHLLAENYLDTIK